MAVGQTEGRSENIQESLGSRRHHLQDGVPIAKLQQNYGYVSPSRMREFLIHTSSSCTGHFSVEYVSTNIRDYTRKTAYHPRDSKPFPQGKNARQTGGQTHTRR